MTPCAQGSQCPEREIGNCNGCYQEHLSFKTHGADMFSFACDERHVCPEHEEVFSLTGTVPES